MLKRYVNVTRWIASYDKAIITCKIWFIRSKCISGEDKFLDRGRPLDKAVRP